MWWLRSPRNNSDNVAAVNINGNSNNYNTYDTTNAARPDLPRPMQTSCTGESQKQRESSLCPYYGVKESVFLCHNRIAMRCYGEICWQ